MCIPVSIYAYSCPEGTYFTSLNPNYGCLCVCLNNIWGSKLFGEGKVLALSVWLVEVVSLNKPREVLPVP